jgi:phage FluMu protein gp41
MSELQSLLNQADAALERHELHEAERLYSQVTAHPAAEQDGQEFKRAVEGRHEIRRRLNTTGEHGADTTQRTITLPTTHGNHHQAEPTPSRPIEDSPTMPIVTPSTTSEPALSPPADPANPPPPAPDPAPSPAEPGPANQESNLRDETIQQEVQKLAEEAQRYLQAPTIENYKNAQNKYRQILGHNLSAAQRQEFEERLRVAEQDYEDLKARFGELTTARQVANQEEELIAIRKLMLSGQEFGPDGEDLNLRFADVLQAVRRTLLRIAGERVSLAEQQANSGMNFLEAQPLEAALTSLNSAIHLIQGEEITGPDTDADTNQAILAIKNVLLDTQAEQMLADYKQHRDRVQEALAAVRRVLPLYQEAEESFQQKQYEGAVTILESLQAQAGTHFSSTLINDLHQRAQQRWGQEVTAQGNKWLLDAQAAIHRSAYAEAQRIISDIVGLEPHLQTEDMQEIRQKAHALLNDMGAAEKEFNDVITRAGQALNHGDYGGAERMVKDVLARRPGYDPARKLLDTIYTNQVNEALRKAETALVSSSQRELEACQQELLTVQSRYVGQISTPMSSRKLGERVDTTLAQLKRASERLRQAATREHEAHEMIDKARMQAQQDDFSTALSTLGRARELMPLNNQIDLLETEIRADWATFLKRQAREFLDMMPPNAASAMKMLDTLHGIGMEDAVSIELRRQADRLYVKEQGVTALIQGNFREAIDALMRADLTDPEVNNKLREARRREISRLLNLSRWHEALDILQQVDSTEAGFIGQFHRASGEALLAEAEELLANKQFTLAGTKLDEARQNPLADIQERAAALYNQIGASQTTFRQVQTLRQQAEAYYTQYQNTNNIDDVLRAIRELDQILDLPVTKLPIDDQQRIEIQELRNTYQRLHTDAMHSIRASLRAEAQQALQESSFEQLHQARQCYLKLQSLSPDQHDPEATRGLEQVRQKLRERRDALAEAASNLLNLRQKLGTIRSVKPAELHDMLQQVEEARAATDIDPDNHQELNKIHTELKDAVVLFDDVSKQLNALRARWAQARRQDDGRIDDILLSLDSIEGLFRSYPYQHHDLHSANVDNLRDQMKRDQGARSQIREAVIDIERALNQHDLTQVAARFDTLRKAEDTTSKISQMLEGGDISHHSNFAHRYPQQSQVLQLLAERITDLLRREEIEPEPAELRTLMAQREALQNLYKRLDPDDRAGLYEKLSSVEMTPQRLDELEQALQKGGTLMQEAQQQESLARQKKEEEARLQEAADLLRDQVLVRAKQARKSLLPVLAMRDASYQVVKSCYASAQNLDTQAEMLIEKLEHEKPWAQFEENIRDGARLLDESRSALHRGEYEDALRLVNESRAKNPALEGDEGWIYIKRQIDDVIEPAPPEHSHWIAVAVVVVLVVLVAIFLGPMLWGQVNDFLFPTGAAVLLV